MSIKVMSWVWENSPTKGSDRLVLLALADSANDEGQCWPSVKTIADKSNLGKRYTQKILQGLEQGGFICVVHRREGDWNQSNVYFVVTGVASNSSLPSEQENTRVTSNKTSGVVSNRTSRTVIKNRNKNHSTQPKSPAFPDGLNTPEFIAAWEEWEQHRREIKKPLTPLAAKKQLARLEEIGAGVAVKMICQSIENGWVGIFPLKDNRQAAEGNGKPQHITVDPSKGFAQ